MNIDDKIKYAEEFYVCRYGQNLVNEFFEKKGHLRKNMITKQMRMFFMDYQLATLDNCYIVNRLNDWANCVYKKIFNPQELEFKLLLNALGIYFDNIGSEGTFYRFAFTHVCEYAKVPERSLRKTHKSTMARDIMSDVNTRENLSQKSSENWKTPQYRENYHSSTIYGRVDKLDLPDYLLREKFEMWSKCEITSFEILFQLGVISDTRSMTTYHAMLKYIAETHGLGEEYVVWKENFHHYRKIPSKETRLKLSRVSKGRKMSAEAKQKISRAQRNRTNFPKWTDERRKKHREGMLGHPVSEETRLKISKSNKGRKVSDEFRKSCSIRYKGRKRTPKSIRKQFETRRKNGNLNSSEPEKRCKKKLIEMYGENCVMAQHYTVKYPFNCDFYIKTLDLYIECDFFWSHGDHAFDGNNDRDIEKVKELYKKAQTSKFYKNVLETWVVRDPLKIWYQTKNNLNFLRFYSPKEFDEWYYSL